MTHQLSFQANSIADFRYKFSVAEKAVLFSIIEKIRNIEPDHSNVMVEMDGNDTTTHEEVLSALMSLHKKNIELTENGNWLTCSFINWAEYNAETNSYIVEVSYKIIPYLKSLANQFSSYALTVAITLPSKWSQGLYELCLKHKDDEKDIYAFQYSITELRELFGIENKYPRTIDFQRRVIDGGIEGINNSFDEGQCDLWMEYTMNGRKDTTTFTFIVHRS